MHRARALPAWLACVSFFGLLGACETETPTTASVRNDYPAAADGGDAAAQRVVYRAWFASTLFDAPVAPGATSAEERTVPTADYVYAVLALGWDPGSGAPPTKLVPLRSKGRLDVARGDLGLIAVSPATFDGDCAAGSALSQDDADFVTQRIFPGAFAGATFDAATCTMRPLRTGDGDGGGAGDAGADVASE
jgi:hypothetical protein